jgi:tetratricopeptide (TPR) repeat protein
MTDLAFDTALLTPPGPAAPVRRLELVQPTARPATDLGTGARLEHAQHLCDIGRFDEGAALFADVTPVPPGRPRLALRALHIETWLALAAGQTEDALATAQRARAIAEGPQFTDLERAETLFRLGACQCKRSATAVATQLLTLALELFDRIEEPCDRLRAHALVWRARCYQRQRDWEAARADVEHALELAEVIGDDHAVAHAYFQASLVAERQGQWLLARYYAEEARKLYESVDDRLNVARLTNNLGGLTFLLGDAVEASRYLEEAHQLALEAGSDADAAQALSSLAQVHLRIGALGAAEQEARTAVGLLEERVDFVDELGNVQLVLGRALLQQGQLAEAGQWFDAAEVSFDELGSTSHRAAAWIAQGDLAAASGDCETAAATYRRAAEALQDFHF